MSNMPASQDEAPTTFPQYLLLNARRFAGRRFMVEALENRCLLSVTWQNVSYNQPAHPGFFLGHGMKLNE